mmetsp:Transcript_12856/g.35500  ORF Transcript_12856/g.35500 Transcript_12856/m.35500 type:complete len:223 (-) Transcript_12856:4-672(-)
MHHERHPRHHHATEQRLQVRNVHQLLHDLARHAIRWLLEDLLQFRRTGEALQVLCLMPNLADGRLRWIARWWNGGVRDVRAPPLLMLWLLIQAWQRSSRPYPFSHAIIIVRIIHAIVCMIMVLHGGIHKLPGENQVVIIVTIVPALILLSLCRSWSLRLCIVSPRSPRGCRRCQYAIAAHPCLPLRLLSYLSPPASSKQIVYSKSYHTIERERMMSRHNQEM